MEAETLTTETTAEREMPEMSEMSEMSEMPSNMRSGRPEMMSGGMPEMTTTTQTVENEWLVPMTCTGIISGVIVVAAVAICFMLYKFRRTN